MKITQHMAALMALLLAGCSLSGGAQPLPTVVLDKSNSAPRSATAQPVSAQSGNGAPTGVARASGVVVPVQMAQMSFTLAGEIRAVNASLGDSVKAGQVLATLNDAALQTQLAHAKAALAMAQANLDVLNAGASPEQVRQAEANALAATANFSRTVAPSRPEDVTAALASLNAANAAYRKTQAGASADDVAAARANLQIAEVTLKQAQARYDDAYRRDPGGIGAHPTALALEQATATFAAAKAIYDKATRAPDEAHVLAALQMVETARAALERARNPARDFDVIAARAQVDGARAQLDALKSGSRPQQLAAAQAQVELAAADVRAVEAQVKMATLSAPFDGVVARVNARAGETILPSQLVMALADVSRLRVETTDLSERDVANVTVGSRASVRVKALGQTVNGRVIAIAPLADSVGGDVVYKTVIELDSRPAGLRAGMSVDVQF